MSSIGSKLIVSEDKIKALFDSVPIPSYVWQHIDDDFILIDYNLAAEKVTEGLIKNYVGQKATVFHKDRPDLLAELNKCIEFKTKHMIEIKYTMKTTGKNLYLSVVYYYVPPDLVLVHTEDISKRKLIEKNLKKSEQRFKHLFQHSPDAIILVNLDGEIIEVNESTIKLFGYKKEDIINKNYLKLPFYPKEYLSLLQSRLIRATQEDELEPLELKIRKKDGNEAWALSRPSILKMGKQKFLYTILADITQQKKYGETLKRKLKIERFLSTISSRFIGNVDIDMTINLSLIEMGKLIGANRAYLLLFNEENSLEFFTQQWCIEDIEPENLESMVIHIEQYPWCLQQCKQHGFVYIPNVLQLPEEALSTKQKLEKLNIKSFLAFPVFIKSELYGFIGFDNIEVMNSWNKDDFSLLKTSSEIIGGALERKWAEETLKGSNQLLAGIISSLTDPICLIDKGHNILWLNNVAKDRFGSFNTSKKCYDFFVGLKKPCKKCIAKKTFSDGQIHECEMDFLDINGNEFRSWSTSSSAAINIEGQTELAVLILRDLSKTKEL